MARKRKPFKRQAPLSAQYIRGKLSLNRKGFGFVKPNPEHQIKEDIFIPQKFIFDAIDGDTVEVELSTRPSEKGLEGQIINVLARSRKRLLGIVEFASKKGYQLYSPLLGPTKIIFLKSSKSLKLGDRVLVKIEEKQKKNQIMTTLIQRLGSIEDASVDLKATIEEYSLRDTFGKEAIDQAENFSDEVLSNDLKGRKDFTTLPCITIDPTTARDYDDAITLNKDKDGSFHLGVHIADVAHYVKPGSPLDIEASQRGNSIYFPEGVIPMLPKALSNNLCSLKEGVIRLTASVLMSFTPQGELINKKIVRGYIKSQKRFTYEEAFEIITTKKEHPLKELLLHMKELGLLLKKARIERGSIDLSLSESKIQVDDKGNPTGVEIIPYDISHQIIEEFMLKANELVAEELEKRNRKLIYRIHEEPDEESFKDFLDIVRATGITVPKKLDDKAIQTIFKKASDTPFLSLLAVQFIRTMKLAIYSVDNLGHYGLSLEHYCHFTSPIRRYADLMIARILFDEVDQEDLQTIAGICSEKERIAFQAEMSHNRLKKMRLLKKYFEEDPYREYPAVISKIKANNLFFDLSELMLEGGFNFSKLTDDFYTYDKKRLSLQGRRTKKTYTIGQKIIVKATHIDLIHQKVEWELVLNKRHGKT